MGCIGDSSKLACVALIVIILSFVCACVAIFTPFWQEQESNGVITYSGLLTTCQNSLSECFTIDNILSAYQGTDQYDDFLVNLSLQMFGFLLIIVSMVLLFLYCCCTFKAIGVIAAITSILAGCSIIAGLIVYGISFSSVVNSLMSWSFGLDVAAAALALTAGILCIINCCLP
ncbi:uncharacterized protein LOC132546487 [Ylistrum balloti]|uniref:uncharacterized protein LOC132546487 n=1 Tax=Ylistrum balloti TaxID=509963 RepID=UPI002905B811|nr:uncharacterized protein LOC132546487 [Ylistrum balloti]